LVYRALDRLVEAGYAEPVSTEKGDAGPQRVVHKITRRGRRRLDRWLATPVAHVRDIRIVFLLKLALVHRRGRSPVDLIRDQKAALLPTLTALETPDADDYLELWRQHNAAAALAYLDDLECRYVT
ncbi:MAG: PadR family transcriptional regulator, partial [Acidimicrobiia bacterium]